MKKLASILASVVIAAISAFGATPEEVIARVNEAMKDRGTLQADFTQTRHSPLLKGNLVSTGSISFMAPQKLRWEVRTPSPSVLVINGGKVMSSSQKGTTTRDISADRRFQGIARNITRASSGPFIDTSAFDVSVLEGDDEWIFRMTPLRRDLAGLFKEIVISAGKESFLVEKAILLDGDGGSTTLEFSNLRLSGSIDQNLFNIQ